MHKYEPIPDDVWKAIMKYFFPPEGKPQSKPVIPYCPSAQLKRKVPDWEKENWKYINVSPR